LRAAADAPGANGEACWAIQSGIGEPLRPLPDAAPPSPPSQPPSSSSSSSSRMVRRPPPPPRRRRATTKLGLLCDIWRARCVRASAPAPAPRLALRWSAFERGL